MNRRRPQAVVPFDGRRLASLGLCWILACGGLSTGCGGSGVLEDIRGTVSVDGAPADLGTVQFRPADTPGARGAGAAIKAGKFQLSADHGLKEGTYSVIVQATKNTGKTIQDPQRGAVPQLAQQTLLDSPKEVEVTSENAANLSLAFHTK